MKGPLKASAVDVIILCGGMGTRLQSVLKDKPKPMADFNDRPFLELLIDYVGSFGFQRFILCTGHKGELIQDYFANKDDDKSYVISQEPSPLGTAGAIKYAEPRIRSNVFLAMNGDSFCEIDLISFLRFHYSKEALVSVALASMVNTSDYGGVTMGENDKITNFDEKKGTSSSRWVNAGVYIFDKTVLSRIPEGQKFSLEQNLFPAMVNNGLFGFTSESQLLDIGTPKRLERARQLLIELN